MLEHLCGYMLNFPALKLVYTRAGCGISQHLKHLAAKDTALSTLCHYDYRGDSAAPSTGDSNPEMDPMFGMTDSDYANTKEKRTNADLFQVTASLSTVIWSRGSPNFSPLPQAPLTDKKRGARPLGARPPLASGASA